MATDTLMSDITWPAVGNPAPPIASFSPDDPNPEWEMIADEHESTAAQPSIVDSPVVIMPQRGGRPRSATIGGDAAAASLSAIVRPESFGSAVKSSFASNGARTRSLRRCASTPDLIVSDNAHEVIVEDETDSDDEEGEDRSSSEDAELVDAEEDEDVLERSNVLEESFEVVSDDKEQDAAKEDDDGMEEEPFMIDDNEDSTGEEESATLVSTPSMGTSSWTMAYSAVPVATSVWGMKKSPSFKDMLAKNLDSAPSGEWGKDKALTEAKLRDSHRRHHLRVRTKPKLVVANGSNNNGLGEKTMKHAHSTGDLSKMLHAVESGHVNNGRSPGVRRVKKQLSAMMEEEEEMADLVIGRGSGNGVGGGGGGEVLGETDAMDYYSRKEHGSKSTTNKKKERPDEAKRREIIMYKKDMQRKKQSEATRGGNSANSGDVEGKKKKNDKGFGGKKERRRL